MFDWLIKPKTKVVTLRGRAANDKSVSRTITSWDRKGYDLVGNATGSRFLGSGNKVVLTFRRRSRTGLFG